MTLRKPEKEKQKLRIYSFVTPATYQQLQDLVDENQSTLSYVVRSAVLNYLKNYKKENE